MAAATVPAAIVGAVGENLIAEKLGEPWQIAILLALFAGLLYVADRTPQTKDMGQIGIKAAVGVGLAQTLSLMPGVSRSGITITAGRFLGLDRDSAARFSFLLLVPITFGAVAFKGIGDVVLADLPPGTAGPFIVGSLASFASALVAISALLGYVRRHTYSLFVCLPADPRGDRAVADRNGRPLSRLLRRRGEARRPNLSQLDITLILVHSRNGIEQHVRGHTGRLWPPPISTARCRRSVPRHPCPGC